MSRNILSYFFIHSSKWAMEKKNTRKKNKKLSRSSVTVLPPSSIIIFLRRMYAKRRREGGILVTMYARAVPFERSVRPSYSLFYGAVICVTLHAYKTDAVLLSCFACIAVFGSLGTFSSLLCVCSYFTSSPVLVVTFRVVISKIRYWKKEKLKRHCTYLDFLKRTSFRTGIFFLIERVFRNGNLCCV